MKRDKFYLITAVLVLMYLFTPLEYIDSHTSAYYDEYMNHVHKFCSYYQYYHPGQVFIHFSELPEAKSGAPIIGFCHKGLNRIDVTLNRGFWNIATHDERYELLSHELTHCMFSEDHDTSDASFMYKKHIPMDWEMVNHQLDRFLENKCG